MEDHKGEFVVIFAGYRDEMKTFIDSNPGIASRIGYTFDFPDYTPNELAEIFMLKTKNMGFKCENGVKEIVKDICEYFAKRKAFGNGRFVDKLIQEVIMNHALNDEEITVIYKKDIPTVEELTNTGNNIKGESLELLDDIIGMKELKDKIKEFEDYVIFQNKAKNSGISLVETNMNMVFVGNSGTGKTTIARIMAKLLFDLGVVKENKLIEVGKKDLVGQYVGQTAPKTAKVIEKAIGGVLFIDEAYSLTEGKDSFGTEAVETLLKAMEDHKGDLVVIFAGYRKGMQQFIDSNPGLASRIGYTFEFPDYNEYELADILYKKIDQCDMEITDKAKENVTKIMKYFCNVENIGNGRFVDKVLQEILIKHAKNYKKNIKQIREEDIPTIKEMIEVVFNGSNMTDPTTITEEIRKRVATHEIGHALVRFVLFKKPGIKRITVNPEGDGTLGYVLHSLDIDKPIKTRTDILNDIKVSMGGMAAGCLLQSERVHGIKVREVLVFVLQQGGFAVDAVVLDGQVQKLRHLGKGEAVQHSRHGCVVLQNAAVGRPLVQKADDMVGAAASTRHLERAQRQISLKVKRMPIDHSSVLNAELQATVVQIQLHIAVSIVKNEGYAVFFLAIEAVSWDLNVLVAVRLYGTERNHRLPNLGEGLF